MKLKLNLVMLLILLSGFAFAQRNTTDTFTPVTITGNITEVNHPIATFKSEDGTEYQIHMGPYWYWLDNGYKLNNESAVITGEVKTVNGINELYPVEVSQNSATIKLTDEKGIPLWASNWGNGNGRGNGYGWNNGNGRGNGNGYGWNNGNCKYDSVKCANCTTPGSCCNNNGGCRYGNGNGKGNGNGYGWRNGKGNGNGNGWRNGNGNGRGNGWGNCQRNTTNNSDSNTGNQNGRGWRQNCPNRTK